MNIIQEISKDIEWRMAELSSLKTIPLRYKLLAHHQEMIIKYTIPSIYALWEGFVRNSFTLYISEINALQLTTNDIHLHLLAHAFSSVDKLRLENPRTNFKSKKEFTETYLSLIGKPFQMPEVVPTNSNVNFEVINEILLVFNLELLPDNFKSPLAKLLKFRNSIAHGEVKIPVKVKHIEFFTSLLNNLMVEITIRIEHGLKTNAFRSNISI